MASSKFSAFLLFLGVFTVLSIVLLFSPIRSVVVPSSSSSTSSDESTVGSSTTTDAPSSDDTTETTETKTVAASLLQKRQQIAQASMTTAATSTTTSNGDTTANNNDDETSPPSSSSSSTKPKQQQHKKQQTPNPFFKVDHTKDQLPDLNAKMKIRIKTGHEIIKKLEPVDIVGGEDGTSPSPWKITFGGPQVLNVKAETITDSEILSWTRDIQRGKETDSFEQQQDDGGETTTNKSPSSRVKFVKTFSKMMELFAAPSKKEETVETTSNTQQQTQSTTHYMYARPFLRWRLNNRRAETNNKTRFACLYAGFTRDFDKQLRGCYNKRRCNKKAVKRDYGFQFDRIIKPLDCDVFLSSWNINGAGRYFTTNYDENNIVAPPSFWMSRLGGYLAAMHVHNYAPYGELWHAAHRFPRSFPQIRVKSTFEEMELRKRDPSRMFGTYNNENKFIRLNDYSQSFKHYCAVLLTWSYETWARGSYDLYFRLRTDERAIRWFVPGSTIAWKQIQQQNDADDEDDTLNKKKTTASKRSTKPLDMKFATVETCPPGAIPVSWQQQMNSTSSASSTTSNQQQQQNPSAAVAAGGDDGLDASGYPSSFFACATHVLSASITHPHQNRSFDSLFSIFQKDFAPKQKVGINAFDIADFAYLGSPEIIGYFGAHIWDFCVQKTPDPFTPAFTFGVVQLEEDKSKFDFSEYNLMLWRMIIDAGWKKETLNNMVRVSRGSMKKV